MFNRALAPMLRGAKHTFRRKSGVAVASSLSVTSRALSSSSRGGGQGGGEQSSSSVEPSFDFVSDPMSLVTSVGVGAEAGADAVTTTSAAVLAAPTFFEKPSYVVMQAIDAIHSALGVPYWEAIVLITIAVRIAMLPMSVMQLKTMSKLAILKPEVDKIQATAMQDPDKSVERRQHYEGQLKALFKKHDHNPLVMLMPFLQLPIFVTFFMGIRDFGDYFPDFKTGGALWFTDLSAADPTYILPVINGISMFLMFEAGVASNPPPQTELLARQQNTMRWVMRAASVAMIPLMISMPNGLFVHWGVNNAMSITQSIILGREDVKKYLGINPIPVNSAPSTPSTPFIKLFQENQNILKEKQKQQQQQQQFSEKKK